MDEDKNAAIVYTEISVGHTLPYIRMRAWPEIRDSYVLSLTVHPRARSVFGWVAFLLSGPITYGQAMGGWGKLVVVWGRGLLAVGSVVVCLKDEESVSTSE